MLWTQNGLNWSTSFFSASNMLYFNRKTHKMEMLIFQRTYFLSHAMGGKKNCHLKYNVFSNFFVKISKKTHVHIIYTKKTNIFLLEKLIRHTCIAILTTEHVHVGQNIIWLQLERRYTWRLEYCHISLGRYVIILKSIGILICISYPDPCDLSYGVKGELIEQVVSVTDIVL